MTKTSAPTAPTVHVERFLRYCRMVNSAMAVAFRSNFVQTVSERLRFGGPTVAGGGCIMNDLQSDIQEETADCRPGSR